MSRKTITTHAFTILCLAGWGLLSSFSPSYQMPSPLAVLRGVVKFLSDLNLLEQLGFSLYHVGMAIFLSFLIGAVLALNAYYFPVLRFAIHQRFGAFLGSFSGVGWALLAGMWFGINSISVIFAISAVLIPFALINLNSGLNNLDSELLEMGRSFSRNHVRSLRKIILPLLYPYIFATLRLMFGVAWKVTLAAELFGGNSGLGYLINLARQDYDTTTIFVIIFLIVAFVYSTERFFFKPVQARLEEYAKI
ncbi:MAG: ABC transporter permease subunit [Paralcaligenes sp.]